MTVVELFTTPNKKTRTGKPARWRWRIVDAHEQPLTSRHSFSTEVKALLNAERDAVVPQGAVLRRPGHPDAAWVH